MSLRRLRRVSKDLENVEKSVVFIFRYQIVFFLFYQNRFFICLYYLQELDKY